jgi:hypothetical protein
MSRYRAKGNGLAGHADLDGLRDGIGSALIGVPTLGCGDLYAAGTGNGEGCAADACWTRDSVGNGESG